MRLAREDGGIRRHEQTEMNRVGSNADRFQIAINGGFEGGSWVHSEDRDGEER